MNHQAEREKAFLEHSGDCFAIYQVKGGEGQRDLRFMDMDWLASKGLTVDRANYELVYTGELAFGQDQSVLEKLYKRFNIDHPADYHRPSMSVSDIVAIKQNDVVSFHYCDSIGFVEVPDFIKKEPTVAQLEQQARSGQPISLTALAAATHREEQEQKQSVVKKLKKQPKQEQKRTAPKRSAERGR